MQRLREKLARLDGGGYKQYKTITGQYRYPGFTLSIDHVQSDPFAAPSRMSIQLPMDTAKLPAELWHKDPYATRKTALEDYLARQFEHAIRQHVKGKRGSGNSGKIEICTNAQQVLLRNAVLLSKSNIDVRFTVGLPANGRRADGRQAINILCDELPRLVQHGLLYEHLNHEELRHHIESLEDQAALREWLLQSSFVAFVGDDASLARASGTSDKPLRQNSIVFSSPESLRETVQLPNAGTITGMAIPKGVTLIVGGGFHGKSTLLHALEHGPYNHIPGDGRERVVTGPNCVKVRAEDGRSVANVDISPFINNLPYGKPTQNFITENASGSTSQAANIIEAIEAGSDLLLIDEDTSASNFMIRDERMQQLVSDDKEPITPLIQRIHSLYSELDISSIIVMGGSGDYFDVADTVIMLDAYRPKDVTERAKALAKPGPQDASSMPTWKRNNTRRPGADVLDPSRRNRDVKIDTKDRRLILYGEHRIDLAQVEQLIDIGQTRSIGLMIHYYAQHYAGPQHNLIEGLQQVMRDVEQRGLDIISPYKVGNLALPRLFELAAAINRIREGTWS